VTFTVLVGPNIKISDSAYSNIKKQLIGKLYSILRFCSGLACEYGIITTAVPSL
jgi:hypothetical protein